MKGCDGAAPNRCSVCAHNHRICDGFNTKKGKRPLPRLYRRMPSLLEYLSYNCNFMGILAGPTCSYNDYKAFIEGTGFQPCHQENANGKENGKCKQSEPSPRVGSNFLYS